MRIRLFALIMVAVSLALATPSFAQNYPNRPITLIVPFAPGGPADLLGRLVGQKISEDLGQQVVIDNRSGANTIVGAQFVARAQPDGYTVLLAIDGTLVMNPFLYAKLAYDPFKDFDPVSLIAAVPSAVTANIKTPVETLKDIIDAEKAKPGTFQIGVSTPTSQVAIGLLNSLAGINLTMVPYRGGTTQITSLLAGDIPLGHESVNVALPLYRDKKIKIIALTGQKRLGTCAGNPADRRDLPGLRPRHLAERGGAEGHAEAGRRPAVRLAAKGHGLAGGARQAHRGGHRADHQQEPGGVRRLHQVAGRGPREGDQGRGDEDRVAASSSQPLKDHRRIDLRRVAGAVHRRHVEVGVGVFLLAGPVGAGLDADVLEIALIEGVGLVERLGR